MNPSTPTPAPQPTGPTQPRPNTPLDWQDISSEAFRQYDCVTPSGPAYLRIDNPEWLAVSKSGGHRIVTADGTGHYIPAGWVRVSWQPKPGAPTFNF